MKIVKFFVVVLQLFEIVYLRRILRAKRQVNEDFLKEIFLQVANNLTNNFETKGGKFYFFHQTHRAVIATQPLRLRLHTAVFSSRNKTSKDI